MLNTSANEEYNDLEDLVYGPSGNVGNPFTIA
jgi:hypothetical protein